MACRLDVMLFLHRTLRDQLSDHHGQAQQVRDTLIDTLQFRHNEATCILSIQVFFGISRPAARCCAVYRRLAASALVILLAEAFLCWICITQDNISFPLVRPLTLASGELFCVCVFHSHSRACCGITLPKAHQIRAARTRMAREA
jgi:hypothetical protein